MNHNYYTKLIPPTGILRTLLIKNYISLYESFGINLYLL